MSSQDITRSDADTLIAKLIDFDASLSDAERAIFRSTIVTAMAAGDGVEGHAMEMRWAQGPEGLFRQWVELRESGDGSQVDPSRWNTFPRREMTMNSRQPRVERATSES